MSLPARVLAATALVAAGALTIASLALVDVVPGWGVLFFYVLPSLFFGVWALRELESVAWRRTITPLRRAWRLSRLGGQTRARELPPAPPRQEPREPPERIESLADLLAVAAQLWLQIMRSLLALLRAPRIRRAFNAIFGIAAVAIVVLVVRQFRQIGWPLEHAQATKTAASVALFISTFALRALAWQRLFRPFERPRSLTLVASNGTAAVAAVALPSRIDDAIAIAIVRKLGRRTPSVGTLALSLFLLGLMDMAALTPFAAYSAIAVPGSAAVRVTMAALTGMGVGAGLLAAALPSIRTSDRLVRFRLGHWLALHAPSSRRDAAWAWLLTAGSWLTRAGGLYLLLDALGLVSSFAVATSYVVAGAGAAALPVGPAGAATQAGVGAAVLAGVGIETAQAVALAVAAQALTVAAGAVIAGFAFAAHLGSRRWRPSAA